MTNLKTNEALQDMIAALRQREIAFVFGWQDVAQRYRRSSVGAFWLSINMAVLISAIGVIFGALFRIPLAEFLPFLACGIIIWSFISTTLSEGCSAFIQSEGIILQVRMPLCTHLIRVWWRNCIIFAHNLVILPLVMIAVFYPVSWPVLLAPLGFLLLSLNLLWICLVLSVICTRFRDVPLVVQNVLQIGFYATPIMWTPETLPEKVATLILSWNPFFHLLSIVREPLLGNVPTMLNWLVSLVLAAVGWVVAIFIFSRYRKKITYWL